MGCQCRSHTGVRHAHLCLMVGSIAIEMLHIVATARTFELAGSILVVRLVVDKAEIVKATLVTPEIRIEITSKHHRSFSAGINISTRRRVVKRLQARVQTISFNLNHAKGFHQIYRRTAPAAPYATYFAETFDSKVRLKRVLASPMTAYSPTPCNKALIGCVVATAENILVVLHQLTTGVINHVLSIISSLLQIRIVERTAYACLGKIYLSEQTFCAIIVNTTFYILLLREELQRFLERKDNIVIYIGFLHFLQLVVVAFSKRSRVTVDNRYITKGANQIEICHRFPGQCLAHALLLNSFARTLGFLNRLIYS